MVVSLHQKPLSPGDLQIIKSSFLNGEVHKEFWIVDQLVNIISFWSPARRLQNFC